MLAAYCRGRVTAGCGRSSVVQTREGDHLLSTLGGGEGGEGEREEGG